MFWSIIAANKRKTVILIVLMGLILAGLGYIIGLYLGGTQYPQGGWWGLLATTLIWLVLLVVALAGADKIFLQLAGAAEIDKAAYPQLYNVVEEMKLAANLNHMPRIFVMDDPAPNAFAVGLSPNKCAVCVTAGLLAVCNRDELQGVIAHEIGHIINRDILYMTVAATMLGATCFLSDIFVRGTYYSGGRRYRSEKSSGGSGNLYLLIAALALAILGPVLSRLLYFSASRKREYLADATSARLTRYPEGLASALEKIRSTPARLTTAPTATAPFYIVNPYKPQLNDNAFATHPPINKRISILRGMAGGAGYVEYVKAYRQVTGKRRPIINSADINRSPLAQKVAKREPLADSGKAVAATAAAALKMSGDIMRAVNGFAFIPCACGMQIKVPPEFTPESIKCPRCGRLHRIPAVDKEHMAAILSAAAAMSAEKKPAPQQPGSAPDEPQSVTRTPRQWQNFTCNRCGRNLQLSPSFNLDHMKCTKCGSTIRLL